MTGSVSSAFSARRIPSIFAVGFQAMNVLAAPGIATGDVAATVPAAWPDDGARPHAVVDAAMARRSCRPRAHTRCAAEAGAAAARRMRAAAGGGVRRRRRPRPRQGRDGSGDDAAPSMSMSPTIIRAAKTRRRLPGDPCAPRSKSATGAAIHAAIAVRRGDVLVSRRARDRPDHRHKTLPFDDAAVAPGDRQHAHEALTHDGCGPALIRLCAPDDRSRAAALCENKPHAFCCSIRFRQFHALNGFATLFVPAARSSALVLSFVFGPRSSPKNRSRARAADPRRRSASHRAQKGTPTMGGFSILLARRCRRCRGRPDQSLFASWRAGFGRIGFSTTTAS